MNSLGELGGALIRCRLLKSNGEAEGVSLRFLSVKPKLWIADRDLVARDRGFIWYRHGRESHRYRAGGDMGINCKGDRGGLAKKCRTALRMRVFRSKTSDYFGGYSSAGHLCSETMDPGGNSLAGFGDPGQ